METQTERWVSALVRRLSMAGKLLALAFGLLGLTATAAFAGTDTYPSKWASIPMDSVFDDWGEYNRECTSFDAWMLHSANGFEMPFHDNASGWKADAQARGYVVDSTPAVGAVGWKMTSTTVGHVVWVESVNGDGTVTVEDYNSDYNGHYGERTVAVGTYQYIHFKDITSGVGGVASHYTPLAADLNGDGYADIILRDSVDGTWHVEYGPNFTTGTGISWAAGANYQSFTGDFNHDGHTDLGLRDSSDGSVHLLYGPGFTTGTGFSWAPGTNYRVFAGDFNGDGYGDVGIRDSVDGTWHVEYGPNFTTGTGISWAAGANYFPYVGDFNGDGHTDMGLYDQSAGVFHVEYGPNFTTGGAYTWAAGNNYQPFAGDFNGDGTSDIGLRDSSTGVLYFKLGSDYASNQSNYQWAAG